MSAPPHLPFDEEMRRKLAQLSPQQRAAIQQQLVFQQQQQQLQLQQQQHWQRMQQQRPGSLTHAGVMGPPHMLGTPLGLNQMSQQQLRQFQAPPSFAANNLPRPLPPSDDTSGNGVMPPGFSYTLSPFMSKTTFTRLYASFRTERGESAELPAVSLTNTGDHAINMYSFFFSVLQCGGIGTVQRKNLWKYVLMLMGIRASQPDSGRYLESVYASIFGDFERYYADRQHEWMANGIVSHVYPQESPPDSIPSQSQQMSTSPKILSVSPEANAAHEKINPPVQTVSEQPSAPNTKQVRKPYRPVVRKLDTFGGVPTTAYKQIFGGTGEARSKRIALVKDDLGLVDVFRLTMMLRSQQMVCMCETLRTLTVLSHDAPGELSLAQHRFLFDELLQLWEKCLVEIAPTALKYDEANVPKTFRSYAELFNEAISCNSVSNTQKDCHSFSTHSPELGVAVATIFCNLSHSADNAAFLIKSTEFCRLMVAWSRYDDRQSSSVLLQNRKLFLSLLQNLGLAFPLDTAARASWILQLLVDVMGGGSHATNDPTRGNSGSALPSNARVMELDELAWMAMDTLAKLSTASDNRRLLCQADNELIGRLTPLLVCELPPGSSYRIRNMNTSNGSGGSDLACRWFEMITVETALVCMAHMADGSSHFRRQLVQHPLAVVVLCRLTTGMSWSNTPVVLHDPAFAGTEVGSVGVQSLMDVRSPVEKERVQEVGLSVARVAARALLSLALDKECRDLMRGSDGGQQLLTRHHDIEMHLIGVTMNAHLPADLAATVSSVLFHLGQQQQEDDHADSEMMA